MTQPVDRANNSADPAVLNALLKRWGDGDESALQELTPIVYADLHKLARSAFSGERHNHTLQATALVNEAYVQLCGADVDWQSTGHFYSLAARLMRRILVNHALSRRAEKRGGGALPITLHDDFHATVNTSHFDDTAMLDLDVALEQLGADDELAAQTVELHYFAGLTYEQIAQLLDTSSTTVKRKLKFARAWLASQLGEFE